MSHTCYEHHVHLLKLIRSEKESQEGRKGKWHLREIYWKELIGEKELFFSFKAYFLARVLTHFSCVWIFETTRTITHQAPVSVGFPRQEYWNGLSFPSTYWHFSSQNKNIVVNVKFSMLNHGWRASICLHSLLKLHCHLVKVIKSNNLINQTKTWCIYQKMININKFLGNRICKVNWWMKWEK